MRLPFYKYRITALLSLILLGECLTPARATIPIIPKLLAQYSLPTAPTLLNQGLQAIQAGGSKMRSLLSSQPFS